MTKFNYADAMKTAAIAATLMGVIVEMIGAADLSGLTQKQKDAKLVRACSNDDVEKVTDLLRAGANPNADLGPDSFVSTPLSAAVSYSKVETVKLLLKAGANPNQVPGNGWAPLFRLQSPLFEGGATQGTPSLLGGENFEELLQLLIQAGADVNVATESGMALIGHIAEQNLSSAKLLLKLGARPHSSILEETTRGGKLPAFEWGISLGLDPKHLGQKGRNLFHFAAESRQYYDDPPATERTKFWDRLLELGVDPLKNDDEGFSPLHLAAQAFNAALVEWLINHKADVNARTRTGAAPLILTMAGGDFAENALPLIRAGADLDAKDNAGKDALAHARETKNWAMITGLLAEGAKIDKPGELALEATKTAAELEITSGRLFSILSPILSTGLNPNVQDTEGTPLLTWAARAGSEEAVKLLIEKGADVNALDSRGRTALMWAEMIRCEPVKRALISAGAKTALRDLDGRTASDFRRLTDPTLSEPLTGISDGKPAPVLGDPKDSGIFGAIQRNDVQAVMRLLKSDPKQIDSNRGEITPLSLASALGRIEIMELLLKHRAKEATKEPFGFTPVHQAIMNHQIEALILLLQATDPKSKEAATERAFFLITETSNSRLASSLIEAGFHPGEFGRSLLAAAAEAGDIKLCEQLLSLGIPVLHPDGEDPQSMTPPDPFAPHKGSKPSILGAAAQQSNAEVLRFLVRRLKDVPAATKNESLIFALQTAADAGHLDVIKFLIEEAQVDANARLGAEAKGDSQRTAPLTGMLEPKRTQTALSLAVASGNVAAVKYLLEQGARIEGMNQVGLPPLVCAISMKQPEMVELLFQHRADVNDPDWNKRIALHYAAEQGDLLLVKRLIAVGADRDARDSHGDTPATLAEKHQHAQVAEWLTGSEQIIRPRSIKASPSQKP